MLESILVSLLVVGTVICTLLYVESLIKVFRNKTDNVDRKIFSIAAFLWVVIITYLLNKK